MSGESSYGGGLRIVVLGGCLNEANFIDTIVVGWIEVEYSALLLAD